MCEMTIVARPGNPLFVPKWHGTARLYKAARIRSIFFRFIVRQSARIWNNTAPPFSASVYGELVAPALVMLFSGLFRKSRKGRLTALTESEAKHLGCERKKEILHCTTPSTALRAKGFFHSEWRYELPTHALRKGMASVGLARTVKKRREG
jgi:hypothetical protein